MRYLSVFSGIEAASVAWEPLGWTPCGFSEIDPFASAVLAHRFPGVTNYGDITKHDEWNGIVRGSVDVLVGGSPCQAFSVAGLRRGLDDPRGQLSLVYLQLAARIRPQWIVWENVPGVLSADGGRAFGAFLGALVELGYGFAWRVLDAQHFGVPQRRRRVFLVARSSGDWRSSAEVLLEPKGLSWNHPTSASPWKKFAADPADGARASGKWWDGTDISSCMTKKSCDQRMPDKGHFAAIVQPVVGTLDTYCGGNGLKFQSGVQGHFVPVMHSFTGTSHAQYAEGVGTLRASGGDLGGGSETIVSIQGNLIGRDQGGPHGVGAQENAPMYTLTKGDVHAVAFRKSKRARDENDFETWVPDETANTLNRFDAEETRTTHAIAHAFYSTGGTHGLEPHPDICPPIKVGSALGIPSPPAVAHTAPLSNRMTVRRLTPVECERLQGFPDGWTLVPYRGKPSADGPRYKALGNSMAVPCMAWIGARIAMVEAQNAVD